MIETLKKIGLVKFGIGAAIVIAAMIALLMLSSKLVSPPLSLLYTNLSQEDSVLISARLDSIREVYQVTNNGRDISVPVSKVLSLRMGFAQEGIPHSGSLVGYEIFDKNEGLGTSQFIYNVNLVRALEGEIARTIGSINQIESARVHLVMPKKELFSKVGTDSSASVVVKMKGSQNLNKQEVSAISHIVATAVPGLKVDNVTIVDNRGKPLKLASLDGGDGASGTSSAFTATENASDFQRATEEKYKQMLEDLIEKSVGLGKVKANVSAEINFDREIINTEVFDPDGQVVRSRKVSEENEKDQEGAGASELTVATNIPNSQGAGGGAGGGSNHNKNKTDEVTNYEISKTITNKISESGRIKKLSIAILVDGIYTSKLLPDGTKSQEFTYTPRSDAEIEKIKLLATSAAGLDPKRDDKIEVINMQFSEEFAALPQVEKPFAWLRDDLDNIVQTVVVGLVIILIMLLIVRPTISKIIENSRVAAEEQAARDAVISTGSTAIDEKAAQAAASKASEEVEESFVGEDFNEDDLAKLLSLSPSDRKRVNLVKYINSTVNKYPEETVAVLRGWLYANN